MGENRQFGFTNASLYQLSYPGTGKKIKGRTQKAQVKGAESKGRRQKGIRVGRGDAEKRGAGVVLQGIF